MIVQLINDTQSESTDKTRMNKIEGIKNQVFTCPIDHLGREVRVIGWQVENAENPALIFLHDIGESMDTYRGLAMSIAKSGHSSYIFNMRGHEQNGKKIGRIEGFDQLVKDLLQVVASVKHKEEGRKPIIVGRGLAALIALRFSSAHSKYLAGVAFIAPTFSLTSRLRPLHRFLIKTMAEFTPNVAVPLSLTPAFANCFRGNLHAGKDQMRPKLTSHITLELLNSIGNSRRLLRQLKVRTLVICPPENQKSESNFFEQLAKNNTDRELLTLKYPDPEKNTDSMADEEQEAEPFESLRSAMMNWLNNT